MSDITKLTQEEEDLLTELEAEFKTRYTDLDPEYQRVLNRGPATAPVVEQWFSRNKRPNESDNRYRNDDRSRSYDQSKSDYRYNRHGRNQDRYRGGRDYERRGNDRYREDRYEDNGEMYRRDNSWLRH